MKKTLFCVRFILVIIFHMNIVKISFSWPGLPYPFHGSSGEVLLGLGLIVDMVPTPDGRYFVMKGDNGQKIYMFNINTGVIEFTYRSGNNCPILEFSPDKTKLIAQSNEKSGRNQSFELYDYQNGRLNMLYEYDSVSIAPDPFSPDGKYLVFHKNGKDNVDYGTMLNIETGEEIPLSPDVSIQSFFSPDGTQLIAAIGGENLYNSTYGYPPYYKYTYILQHWDLNSNTLSDSQALEDIFNVGEQTLNSRLSYLRMNVDHKSLLAVEDQSYPPAGGIGASIHIFDPNTGKLLRKYIIPLTGKFAGVESYAFSYNIKLSHDKKWMAFFAYVQPAGLIDVTKEISLDEMGKTDLYVKGPYVGWTNGAFDLPSENFYFLKKRNFSYFTSSKEYIFGKLNVLSDEIQEEHIARRDPISIAALQPDSPIVAIDYDSDIQIWDYEQCEILQSIDLPDIKNGLGSAEFSPDGQYLLWGLKNTTQILDASSRTLLGSVISSASDDRTTVNYSHDMKTFLTATGVTWGEKNKHKPGTDNLIRIWNTDTWDMVREIHGHTDSVWYAAFSPDDQRIVSASLDGTAKVWNVESGSLVSEFVGHATGVVYAEFLPDGQRVLSAGNDRRAYIWNTETAAVEQTIENIHLPAQLSPDGKYLFAGSEVWEFASGQVIKTLDGIAQDYTCLTLSPDGTLLLTSETNGLTKVWNVQEHIFGSSGIENFDRY